jgi:hypothetical protein
VNSFAASISGGEVMKNKFVPVSMGARDAEAAKTSRLKALRLAKEATDRDEAAERAAAAARLKTPPKRRARTQPPSIEAEPR